MSEEERQRLRQLEQATGELADSLGNLQGAVEAHWAEEAEQRRRDRQILEEINQTVQILHDQNRAVFRRLTTIEEILDENP